MPIAWDIEVGWSRYRVKRLAGLPCRHIYILSYQYHTEKPMPVHLRHRHISFRSLSSLDHHHSSLMLRLSLFTYTAPLFGPVAPRSGLRVLPLRSFGSVGAVTRPRILEVLRNRRPNVVTKPFQQHSRGIVDSAVISRPSQTESWRRYAVTAVCYIAARAGMHTKPICRLLSPVPSLV